MTDGKKLIIFVCTGNTCRSPMAEALFRKRLARSERNDIATLSRGLSAVGGLPAAPYAVYAMQNYGCDISSHRSAPLTEREIAAADIFVCMTDEHATALAVCGVPTGKTVVLGVPDPFGGTADDYISAAAKIDSRLEDIYALLI